MLPVTLLSLLLLASMGLAQQSTSAPSRTAESGGGADKPRLSIGSSQEEKLRYWNSLSPEQKQALREKAKSLDSEKLSRLRTRARRFREMPKDRQRKMRGDHRRFRGMRPERRDAIRKRFSQRRRGEGGGRGQRGRDTTSQPTGGGKGQRDRDTTSQPTGGERGHQKELRLGQQRSRSDGPKAENEGATSRPRNGEKRKGAEDSSGRRQERRDQNRPGRQDRNRTRGRQEQVESRQDRQGPDRPRNKDKAKGKEKGNSESRPARSPGESRPARDTDRPSRGGRRQRSQTSPETMSNSLCLGYQSRPPRNSCGIRIFG